MAIELILSISAGTAAIIGVYINYRKWRQEKKTNERTLKDLEDKDLVTLIHSEVTRESLAIKGAQEAVSLMERMLAVAAQSEQKLQDKVQRQQERIQHLEEENEKLKCRIKDQDKTILDMTRRLEALENK